MKFTTRQGLRVLALIIALTVVAVCAVDRAKPSPHPQQHVTSYEFWQSVRMMPLHVSSVEGTTLYWSFTDTHEVRLGSFEMDEHTELPKQFKGTGDYIAIYCEKHKVLYKLLEAK
jgi:hypothetical protein